MAENIYKWVGNWGEISPPKEVFELYNFGTPTVYNW